MLQPLLRAVQTVCGACGQKGSSASRSTDGTTTTAVSQNTILSGTAAPIQKDEERKEQSPAAGRPIPPSAEAAPESVAPGSGGAEQGSGEEEPRVATPPAPTAAATATEPPSAFQLHDRVKIKDLAKKPEYNGEIGKVIKIVENEEKEKIRYGVEIFANKKQLSLLAKNLEKQEGDGALKINAGTGSSIGTSSSSSGIAAGNKARSKKQDFGSGFLKNRKRIFDDKTDNSTSAGSNRSSSSSSSQQPVLNDFHSLPKEKQVQILFDQAGTLFHQNEFRLALTVFQQAFQLCETDEKLQGHAYRYLANCKEKMRLSSDCKEALEDLKQALRIAHLHSDFVGTFDCLTAFGSCYMSLDDRDAAEIHYRQALELSKRELEGLDWQFEARALVNLGISLRRDADESGVSDYERYENTLTPTELYFSQAVEIWEAKGHELFQQVARGGSTTENSNYAAGGHAAVATRRTSEISQEADRGPTTPDIAPATTVATSINSYIVLLTNFASTHLGRASYEDEKEQPDEAKLLHHLQKAKQLLSTGLTYCEQQNNLRLAKVIKLNLNNNRELFAKLEAWEEGQGEAAAVAVEALSSSSSSADVGEVPRGGAASMQPNNGSYY
ncbi:unnamed protein product [Amoebophrya sp. A120]|nr:unnamed protein product [Amoebophrya sp. A120]|eukprot:GSA120T00001191001.1